jgi:hypothetical protein
MFSVDEGYMVQTAGLQEKEWLTKSRLKHFYLPLLFI